MQIKKYERKISNLKVLKGNLKEVQTRGTLKLTMSFNSGRASDKSHYHANFNIFLVLATVH